MFRAPQLHVSRLAPRPCDLQPRLRILPFVWPRVPSIKGNNQSESSNSAFRLASASDDDGLDGVVAAGTGTGTCTGVARGVAAAREGAAVVAFFNVSFSFFCDEG